MHNLFRMYKYSLYHKSLKILIFQDDNACDTNPCKNDGTCIDDVYSYVCNCLPGYDGENCETGITKSKMTNDRALKQCIPF